MSAQPQWESVDNYTTDLLDLVALGSPSLPTADDEWQRWQFAARTVANENDGIVDPNLLRPLVRGVVAHQRLGAFVSRAVARKLIEPTGQWVISDDTEGRNAGRPARQYRWIGDAA